MSTLAKILTETTVLTLLEKKMLKLGDKKWEGMLF
jgi:hypothetical protein